MSLADIGNWLTRRRWKRYNVGPSAFGLHEPCIKRICDYNCPAFRFQKIWKVSEKALPQVLFCVRQERSMMEMKIAFTPFFNFLVPEIDCHWAREVFHRDKKSSVSYCYELYRDKTVNSIISMMSSEIYGHK